MMKPAVIDAAVAADNKLEAVVEEVVVEELQAPQLIEEEIVIMEEQVEIVDEIEEEIEIMEEPVEIVDEIEEEIEIVEEPVEIVDEIEEEIEIVEEPVGIVDEIEEEAVETLKVAIIDEADNLELKYAGIESVEQRAFEVLKDMGIVKPAPQHFSFSYINEVPELRVEPGTTYMDALGNPAMALTGAGSMSGYLDSILNSDSSTFAKGKTAMTTSYLDEICDIIEPFMDCDKTSQPKSPKEEAFLQKKYSQIKDLGDRCFQVLVDLCMVGRCGPN
jgi:hypothetical protein